MGFLRPSALLQPSASLRALRIDSSDKASLARAPGRAPEAFPWLQELPGHGVRVVHDLFGGACGHYLAAVFAAAGAEVDDVVGRHDDVGVVFDDDDGGALVHQGVEHADELAHLVHVQAGGGLVQDVERAGQVALAELAGDFDALGLAAGQGGGGLAELDVFQADLGEHVELAHERRVVGEELTRLAHGHGQHVRDVLAPVLHLQGLGVVALALAGLAGDVDVGQEVHLDLDLAVALARLAPAALDVEGEPAGLVAARARLLGPGEDLADLVENLGVGGRVGARGAADGRLVDGDDLLDLVQPVDAADLSGIVGLVALVKLDVLVERVHDQGGLARTGHAGDAGHDAQRDGHVQVLEVVGLDLAQGDGPLGGAPGGGRLDEQVPAQILAGQGIRLEEFVHRALVNDLAAEPARGRADLDDVVRLADGGLIVLDHKHGVAARLERAQGVQEALVVPGVQTDGGLVQHVGHAHQAGPELGGEPDALGLAARERGHVPAQREVFESHVDHEAELVGQLLEQRLGDERLLAGEFQILKPVQGALDGQGGELEHVQVGHAHGQRLGPQARALAVRAGARLLEPRGPVVPDPGYLLAVFQDGHHALPVGPGVAVEQVVPGLGSELDQGRVQGEAVQLAELLELGPVLLLAVGGLPGDDPALVQGQPLVGRDQVGLEIFHAADAVAGGAGPLGRVEGEELRGQARHGNLALGTGGQRGHESVPRIVPSDHGHDHALVAPVQGQLHGVGQPLFYAVLDHQPVHYQLDGVFLVLFQVRQIVQGVKLAADAHAHEPLLAQLGKEVLVRALLVLHQGGEEHELGARLHGQDGVHDGVRGLGLDGAAALGTVEPAQPGEEHAQEVVDLGDRAHGGARVAGGGLLLQRDGRGEPLDLVYVRLVHLGQELPGIGGQRLHVAALPLGVDDVKGQGGLARPGRPAHDHELVARNIQGQVLEIVVPGTLYVDGFAVRGSVHHGMISIPETKASTIHTGKRGAPIRSRQGRYTHIPAPPCTPCSS